jgi:hypothetical protein
LFPFIDAFADPDGECDHEADMRAPETLCFGQLVAKSQDSFGADLNRAATRSRRLVNRNFDLMPTFSSEFLITKPWQQKIQREILPEHLPCDFYEFCEFH